MPAFSANDIKQYRSAATVGSINSMGGAITVTEVGDDLLHGMFDLVTEQEAKDGKTEHRIVFIKNINVTEDMLNVRALVIQDSTSPNTVYAVGWMPSAVSNSTEILTAESQAPASVVWNESSRLQDQAILGANLPRNGGYAALALRRRVLPGAQPFKNDTARVVILCDNLDVGTPIPTGPPVPPVVDVGVIGEIDVNKWWQKILENFKYRNMFALFTTGNNIGGTIADPAHFANDWLAMFPDVLRKLTWPCFGQRDRRPLVRNAIREHFGLKKTYYAKRLYNIHVTVLDTSDPALVPYDANSDQFKEMKKAIEQSRQDQTAIDWRVVIVNRAAYAATTTPSEKKFLDTTIRDVWAPMFEANQVHVVVQGTMANTQILHVLEYNTATPDEPIVKFSEQAPNYSFQGAGFDKGVMYVICGSGGARPNVIANSPAWVRFAQSIYYGGLRLRFDSSGQQKKLIIDFIDDNDRVIEDARTTITKT